MEPLEDLVVITELVMPHASGMGDYWPGVRLITEAEHLSRRLSQVHDSLMKVKRDVQDKELDMCVLEGQEERLKSVDTNLQGIKRNMLLNDDYESLAEKASFKPWVVIKCLLRNMKTESTTSKRQDWAK